MKIRFLSILLLVLGFSQLGAFGNPFGRKQAVAPESQENVDLLNVNVTDAQVKVLIQNKSTRPLASVRLVPTRGVFKVGTRPVKITVEGKSFTVPVPTGGKPHGVLFKDIGVKSRKEVLVKLNRFDVSKIAVTYKKAGRFNRDDKKSYRVGRLKFDCHYWNKLKRSYTDIELITVTVYDNYVELMITSAGCSMEK